LHSLILRDVKVYLRTQFASLNQSEDLECRDDPWASPISSEFGEEAYDISALEQDPSRNPELSNKPHLYADGKSIDWLHEESAERERQHKLQSLHGISGLLKLILVSSRMWFVIIATGVGVGITGAWLDVLVKW
jgi:chloride channel 3/4/5